MRMMLSILASVLLAGSLAGCYAYIGRPGIGAGIGRPPYSGEGYYGDPHYRGGYYGRPHRGYGYGYDDYGGY